MLTVALATLGTLLELVFIGHYEGVNQLIPILVIGITLISFLVLLFFKTFLVRKVFKAMLIVSAVSGLLGVYFHLDSNFQFEKEIRPNISSADLFWESLSGALPVLAPMNMLVFTLLGFIYLSLINNKNETN